MSTLTRAPEAAAFDLQDARLLVPTVQREPLPIRAIESSPCNKACPAGINVKSYVSLIAEGRFAEALEVIRERCPLPAVCGRVCHHPCETVCTRGQHDDPIAIKALKRFATDSERDNPAAPPQPAAERSTKVAVIGSGPAGLTAAYDLRLAGYPVTVFEAEPEPGGMLRYGIADYRLPGDVLDAEIGFIARTGVDIRTGVRLGEDLQVEDLMSDGYHAVLLAVGAQTGRRLGLEGEEGRSDIEDALAFLRRVNEGDHTPVKGKVVVIGGGSTAIEAARTALRLGAESVELIYRRYREEMLAAADEIEAAESEGVNLRFLVTPNRLLLDDKNRLQGLECVKIGLGLPDSSGRRRPIIIPGSEFEVPADRVLAAVGQEAVVDFLSPQAKSHVVEKHRMLVDDATAMSCMAGFFAAGDVVTGPATVIEAIAAGHQAADSIRNYVENGRPGIPLERPARPTEAEYELVDGTPVRAARSHPPLRPVQPGREFDEVEEGFTRDQAVAEAERCLRCGPCSECKICATTCRQRHFVVRACSPNGAATRPTAVLRTFGRLGSSLPADQPADAALLPGTASSAGTGMEMSEAADVELLPARVRVLEDMCRGCGSCVEACPFDALRLAPGRDAQYRIAHVEPAACRGCNLCASVCPTQAMISPALSPQWWASRLKDVRRFATSGTAPALPCVVVACERRCGVLEPILEHENFRAQVIRLRCTGQIDAGMLLELRRHGARRIIIAGCQSQRCRYGSGAKLAAEQVERAAAVHDLLGGAEPFVICDWSGNRLDDPLEELLKRHMLTIRGPKPAGS